MASCGGQGSPRIPGVASQGSGGERAGVSGSDGGEGRGWGFGGATSTRCGGVWCSKTELEDEPWWGHGSMAGERWSRSMGSDAARATELGNVEGFDLMLEGRERPRCSLLQVGMVGLRPASCSRRLGPFARWHKPHGAGVMGAGTGQRLQHGGDCDGCRRRQILAAYSYFFQQLVFWGHTNVSVSLLFECAGGVAPGLHFPSRAEDRLKLQAFTAAQAYIKGEGDLGCHGGLAPASGGFLWAQRCTLALGFFGTCEGREARVEMLLCRTAPLFLAVPGPFAAP